METGAIDGSVIRLIGLEATITDVFVRISRLDGTETTAIARPDSTLGRNCRPAFCLAGGRGLHACWGSIISFPVSIT